MTEKVDFSLETNTKWSKTRRDGNDEVPAERRAIKIIRLVRTPAANDFANIKSNQTKITKLIYEPTSSKSVHSRTSTNSTSSERRKVEEVKDIQNPSCNQVKSNSKEENVDEMKSFEDTTENIIAIINERNQLDKLDHEPGTNIGNSTNNKNEQERFKEVENGSDHSKFLVVRSTTTRSKSDANINLGVAKHTASRVALRSKSSTNLKTSKPKLEPSVESKKKSYDPELARKYMEDQRKKRKIEEKSAKEKNIACKIEKEEIKKRLENLRKDSLKILDKNMKNAQKKSSRSTAAQSQPKSYLKRKEQLKPQKHSLSQNIRVPKNSPQSVKSSSELSSDKETTKKVGILRREKSDDCRGELDSPTKDIINKNNVALESVLSKFIENYQQTAESAGVNAKRTPRKSPSNLINDNPIPPEKNHLEPKISDEKTPPSIREKKDDIIEELKLEEPKISLKPKLSFREKAVQAGEAKAKKSDVPHWLKPSSVQIYPFNFIMAVRKKLEAVTNASMPAQKVEKSKQARNFPQETAISRPKNDKRISQKMSSNLETVSEQSPLKTLFQNVESEKNCIKRSDSYTSITSSLSSKQSVALKAVSVLDDIKGTNDSVKSSKIESNFSSISIHLLESNTISEVSSIPSERIVSGSAMKRPKVKKHKKPEELEDTTISSSIFSSPEKNSGKKDFTEKREISPLKFDNINNMQISTRENNNHISKRTENHQLPHVKDPKNGSSKHNSYQEFGKLLEDFNKSLSQVIEVNEQIKSALNTSRDGEENASENQVDTESKGNEYSADFEETPSSDNVITRSNKSSKASSSSSTSIQNSSAKSKTENILTSSKGSSSIENFSKARSNQNSDIPTEISQSKSVKSSPEAKLSSVSMLDGGKPPISSRSSALSENFDDSNEGMSKSKLTSSPLKQNGSQSVTRIPVEEIQASKLKQPNNEGGRNYSKDSLDEILGKSTKDKYLKAHVNIARGDFLYESHFNEEVSEKGPPAYSKSGSLRSAVVNSSFGSSEILAQFNQSDVSVFSQTGSISDRSLNYSSIGMYEQLLQMETSKSESLTILLKMREKALIYRTKGQIACLELQKEKCKSEGITTQISTIKKKQRALLLKMEKEREDIKRLLQHKANELENSNKKFVRKSFQNVSKIAIKRKPSNTTTSRSNAILKGYELKPNQNLENMLQKREMELKRRRAHVENLLLWHKRLDKEEEEVLQLEQMLLRYNVEEKLPQDAEKQKRVDNINNSLRELQSISSREDESEENDCIRTSGYELNKLWRRLTGQKLAKYQPSLKYNISKRNLEELYEEAKIAVLHDFGHRDEIEQFLGVSKVGLTSASNNSINEKSIDIVPAVDLNFSSTQSDVEPSISSSASGKMTETVPDSEFSKRVSSKSLMSVEIQSERTEPFESDHSLHQSVIASEADDPQNKEITEDVEEDIVHSEDISVPVGTASNEIGSGNPETENILVNSPSDYVAASQSTNQNSDTEKIDTFREIASLSFDSNKSPESVVKTSNYDNTFINEEQSATVEDLENCTTNISEMLSNEESLKEEDNHSKSLRSSVITRISHIENVQPTNNCSTSITSEFAVDDFPSQQYSNSFPSYVGSSIITDSDGQKGSLTSTVQNTETVNGIVEINQESIQSQWTSENADEHKALDENCQDYLNNETLIEDISEPKFESLLIEDSRLSIEEPLVVSEHLDLDDELRKNERLNTTELEKRLIDVDESLKDLHETFERALSPEKSPTPSRSRSPLQNNLEEDKENRPANSRIVLNSPQNTKADKNNENSAILMPDIINEVETRRRQQILLETDLKQFEHAVPYVFLREIPNKPPPPYVPPAHGSPMTTIFPSPERIQDITFRRVKELYEEMTEKTEIINQIKQDSIMNENITNIYERIILDICKEMMMELQPTFDHPNPETYKFFLSLYNPPNRLNCLQHYIYEHIRKYLAMDKKFPRRNFITDIGQRKRDHVDEILVQELYEEEHKWNNFDIEEVEVKKSVTDEIFNDLVKEVLEDFIEAHKKKIRSVVEST